MPVRLLFLTALRFLHQFRCTPATSPLFSHKLLKPRCHLTAIGSYKPHMREFDLEALMQDDPHMNVYVDSAEACMAEAGELQFLAKDDRRVVELIDATEQQEGRTIYKVSLLCCDVA